MNSEISSPNEITAYVPVVTGSEAAEKLGSTDDEIHRSTFVETVYYPYQIATINVELDGFLSQHKEVMEVGIDLINGREILIDDAPEIQNIQPEQTQVLQSDDEAVESVSKAKEYIVQIIQQHHRILELPDLDVKDIEKLYRPFHLVRAYVEDGSLMYTVDSISGNLHRVYPHDK